MELRRSFANEDLGYLANLCHNCRGCLYACPYAPPHEFGINLPRTFAEVRNETYEEYAWPRPLAAAFKNNGVVLSLAAGLALVAVFICSMMLHDPAYLLSKHTGAGSFYKVIPFPVMLAASILTFGYAVLALVMGFFNFWRDIGGRTGDIFSPTALKTAASDALSLKYLGGGGHGCNDQDESFSSHRRWSHHALFYGFLLCTASTIVAGIYDHFLQWIAPYPFLSLPVVLGTLGGIGMLVGCGGLFALKLLADQTPAARNLLGADVALILLLGISALSGLALLAFRSTSGMGVLLAIHLSFILALFLVMPYSKFVHSVYRSGALLWNAIERKSKHE